MEGGWTALQTVVDVAAGQACGTVTGGLSPFVVGHPEYPFTGFFAPVANGPSVNVARAGQAIRVKFSLGGYRGLSIFAPDSPASGNVACDPAAVAVNVATTTVGSSSLAYDSTADQYVYVWKTDSRWSGGCRHLVVTLKDGTPHIATFRFR